MKPQIVIFSHREDEHALAALSAFSADVTPFLLDIGRTGTDFVVTRSASGVIELVCRNGDLINFDNVGFWWNRRPKVRAFEGVPSHHAAAQEAELEEFWIGVLGHGLPGFWCNPFDTQRLFQNKIRQFHVAQSIGLKTPETIWTNSPIEVSRFLERQKNGIVFKMFSGTESVWQPCQEFSEKFIKNIEHVRYMPSIYQEYISGNSEYRITIFGDHCFSARADLSKSRFPTDVRIDLSLKREVSNIDSEVERLLRRFMKSTRLEFATFDVREDDNGDLVFLECNPMGQFLYLDNLFQGKILKSFCSFAESHAKNTTDRCYENFDSTDFDFFSRPINIPIYEAADQWIKHMPALDFDC